jgi:hypothetical protein
MEAVLSARQPVDSRTGVLGAAPVRAHVLLRAGIEDGGADAPVSHDQTQDMQAVQTREGWVLASDFGLPGQSSRSGGLSRACTGGHSAGEIRMTCPLGVPGARVSTDRVLSQLLLGDLRSDCSEHWRVCTLYLSRVRDLREPHALQMGVHRADGGYAAPMGAGPVAPGGIYSSSQHVLSSWIAMRDPSLWASNGWVWLVSLEAENC